MASAADVIKFKLPRDAGEDSFDLLPALEGTARSPIRAAVVHHSNQRMFSIRWRNWKLELGLGSGLSGLCAGIARSTLPATLESGMVKHLRAGGKQETNGAERKPYGLRRYNTQFLRPPT